MIRIAAVCTGLLLAHQLFSLSPKAEYDFTPEDFGITYEEFKIQTDDKFNLNAWLLEPLVASKKSVVFCHSGEGNMADFIEHASNFVSLGYNVVMFDYRGYGTSDSFKVNTKFYIYSQFARDVTAALDWVRKYHAVWSVDVYGVGMGGGLGLAIAANRLEVKNVVADGAYASFEKVAKAYEAKGEKKMMPLGYDKEYMEPEFALVSKGSHLRVLFIASGNDPIVTSADTYAVAKLAKKSEVYVVNSETNEKNLSTDKDTYYRKISDFISS
jgi:cephalosporin-C deacetylase-like acetyl esterase